MEYAYLSDRHRLPALGPEILDVLFELGCATAAQLGDLLPRRPALRTVQHNLRLLRGDGGEGTNGHGGGGHGRDPLVAGAWRTVRWASLAGGGHAKHAHYLTPAGVEWVAVARDLHRGTARSLYAQVLQDATAGHALLRNEYYARLCRELAASPLGLDRLCAEAGLDPIQLQKSHKGYRRFLNPDGLMEFYDAEKPSFYARCLIESDTGNQTHSWQIAGKVNQYAEYLMTLLRTEGARDLPRVLFVSGSEARSLWVREVLRKTILREGTRANETYGVFRKKGANLPGLFAVTNLRWVEDHGALGRSYWYLSSEGLVPLF